jgi:hypothetical protein
MTYFEASIHYIILQSQLLGLMEDISDVGTSNKSNSMLDKPY